MFNFFCEKINELYNIINAPIDKMFKIMALDKYKNMFNNKENNFSKTYIKFMEKEKGKSSGIVYTPYEIAEYIVENTITIENIVQNPYLKILDPACGCGNILIPCFQYLKKLYENNFELINNKNNTNFNKYNIEEHIINNNLYGFDMDDTAIKILSIDLFSEAQYFQKDNLTKKDFLIDEDVKKFDIIVGNPPYIGHKSIDKDYSAKLKKMYKNIYKDKGDVSYCFFQSALNNLNKKGKLAFITSRYFIEAPSGEELRKILKEVCSLYKIVDFYGIRPFKKAGIDPVIIFLKNDQYEGENIEIIKPIHNIKKNKDKFYNSLFFNNENYYKKFNINKNILNNKGWILRDKKEREIISKIEKKSFTHLFNICESFQGIITGCDKAFVVNEEIIKEENLEIDIIKPWIKSSYINKRDVKQKDNYLIYSDNIVNEQDYSNIINHIKKQKERLMQRRECKTGARQWYQLQWGRRKEIFEKEKIIFPYKASTNRFVLDKGKYFSADVYALVLKENVPFTYEYLLALLNSKVYEFYFQTFAKKLGDDMFEYYPNNLMKLCIPTIGKKENLCNEEIYELFDFNDEEINIIKEYTK
ncbi:N-6 DNA methylase [Clostridium aestuarii]|uniref:site-specific DNA-methyltransferase (adenine-specific) n=1 Tax=Clostridium aestuarii TaxID=338193 RepID=A0ABT4CX62_9CLOT|nr:N-6 DNA methylase [Clostridium aestuarii]MCY6483584.1 N-6 DNA methylase [Clostridium aestuarii]